MRFWGFTPLDLLMIALYFAVVLYIGFRAMKRIRTREDYFLGGRRFGRWIQTFAAFGQGTSAESAVTSTTVIGQNGAAGIGFSLAGGLLGMPVFWMTTMWFRRLRLLTFADFFEERYGSRRMAGFYALTQAVFFIVVAAMGFSAMSKTVAAIALKPESALTAAEARERGRALERVELQSRDFQLLSTEERARLETLQTEKPSMDHSYINRTLLMIALAVIVLLYAVAGGLEAAFVSDLIQGLFIIILTIMLIPFAMLKINAMYGVEGFLGPFQALHQQLPASFFQIFGSPALAKFTWYYILAISVMSVLNTQVQANQMTAAGSAKDDETARIGFLNGMFIKRYCTVFWCFLAMLTLLLYARTVTDPDFIWGMATRDLLGTAGFGLVGLMVACLMAALMSTADAHMLTTAALLTNSVYRPLVPDRSEAHYVRVGRIFGVVYLAGGVLLAMAFDDILKLFLFMLAFNSMVAASFWLGMTWRRANRIAAWVSIGVTFAFTLALPVLVPLVPGVRDSARLARTTAAYPVVNEYTAGPADLREREAEIARWDARHALGGAEGERPAPLTLGQRYEKTQIVPEFSIFWQQGLDRSGERPRGKGMLNVELVVLDALGLDLTKFRISFIETLTYIARVLIPFGLLLLVGRFTRPMDARMLDRFYGRLRTAVKADRDADAEEMRETLADPHRFDHLRLFPNSNWEFRKWTRADWRGMGWVSAGIVGVVVLAGLIVRLGA